MCICGQCKFEQIFKLMQDSMVKVVPETQLEQVEEEEEEVIDVEAVTPEVSSKKKVSKGYLIKMFNC